MTSSNLIVIMLSFFVLSMGQSFGFDSNLFGGRNQFLCFGENSDIVKLNDEEPKEGVLGANLFRRYSFSIQSFGNKVKCSTTGTGGDIDLFMCTYSDGEKCIAEASIKSDGAGSTESVTSTISPDTWYIIVKAGTDLATYTITCDEEFSF